MLSPCDVNDVTPDKFTKLRSLQSGILHAHHVEYTIHVPLCSGALKWGGVGGSYPPLNFGKDG